MDKVSVIDFLFSAQKITVLVVDIERYGRWVESGCSLLPTTWSYVDESPPQGTIVAMICSDCTPRTKGPNQEFFSCDCPSY